MSSVQEHAHEQVPEHPPRRTAVVVVTYGSHELLDEHLASLDLDAVDATAIVVDNFHSTAEQAAIALTAQAHDWDLVQLDANVGFGPAVNRGVAEARRLGADTVVILNPDATVDADTVAQLAGQVRAEPRSVVAPRIVRTDGTPWFRGGILELRTGRVRNGVSDDPTTVPWLTGACLAVSVDLFEEVGGFDPDYFLYFEDVDLSWRCREAGARLLLREDLVAVHAVGATQDGLGKSALYQYYNCRNRLLFAAKHLPRRQLLGWLWWTPKVSWETVRRGGGRRQLLRSPDVLWSALRGTVAGVRTVLGALVRPRTSRATS